MQTPATSLQPLAIPLSRNRPNLAPATPIINAIQNKKLANPNERSDFDKCIKQAYDDCMRYELQSWNESISAGQLVALLINGDHLLQRRPYGPGYYVRPLGADDTYRQTAMNMMRFYYQCCETKMVSANPSVQMRAGGDEPIDVATATAARPVVDFWESQFYTGKFVRRESMYAATNGMFIHRVRWNPLKGEWTVPTRGVSEQTVQFDEGWGECAQCGLGAPAKEFPETPFGDQCPQCGTAAVDIRRPQPKTLPQVTIGANKQLGEPEIVQTPFAGWRWDLHHDLEDSIWAIYRQRITQGAINLMLGDLALPDSASSDDKGLDVIHALAYGSQAVGGSSTYGAYRRDDDRRPTMAEFWIPPEMYGDWPIPETMTVSGQKLPSGKMRDYFHEPICAVGLNDFGLTIGVFNNETHRDEVVTGQWFIKSDSGTGRGMQDAASVQLRYNAVQNQIYQGLAGTATPAVLADLRMMKEDQSGYLFKPNTTIDINLSMLPPGLGLKDAIYLGSPGNVNQQYINYATEYLRDMFQVSSLVTEFSDFMSIDNRTATGAQITAGLANSLFGPMLLVKGESRVRIAKIIVRLEATYGSVARYFPGKIGGRSVAGKDLKGRVIYELVANSELPVTPFSQQSDVRSMLEATGGAEMFLLLKQKDPAMFRQIVGLFNFKPEAEDSDVVNTIMLDRVEQMKQLFQMGVNDPQMLVQGIRPPVSRIEPKLDDKARWCSDFLDTDTGLESPIMIRAAVEGLYWVLKNYDTQTKLPDATNQGLIAGAQQAAMQAPSALGSAALQNMTGGGQQEQQAQAQDHEHEAQQAHFDRQQSDAQQARDHDQQLEIENVRGQNALALAQEQGKNQISAAKVSAKKQKEAA